MSSPPFHNRPTVLRHNRCTPTGADRYTPRSHTTCHRGVSRTQPHPPAPKTMHSTYEIRTGLSLAFTSLRQISCGRQDQWQHLDTCCTDALPPLEHGKPSLQPGRGHVTLTLCGTIHGSLFPVGSDEEKVNGQGCARSTRKNRLLSQPLATGSTSSLPRSRPSFFNSWPTP